MAGRLRRLYLDAGQVKAGTTYLYAIMKTHRDVHFSREKELSFLSQRFGGMGGLRDSIRLRQARKKIPQLVRMDVAATRCKRVLEWGQKLLVERFTSMHELPVTMQLRKSCKMLRRMLESESLPAHERIKLLWDQNDLRPIKTPGWHKDSFPGIRDVQ